MELLRCRLFFLQGLVNSQSPHTSAVSERVAEGRGCVRLMTPLCCSPQFPLALMAVYLFCTAAPFTQKDRRTSLSLSGTNGAARSPPPERQLCARPVHVTLSRRPHPESVLQSFLSLFVLSYLLSPSLFFFLGSLSAGTRS